MNALSSTCVEAQEQAKQKLQDWLNGIDEKDLDLSFLTKVNLKSTAPDLALVQRNKVLEAKNQKLEKDLLE